MLLFIEVLTFFFFLITVAHAWRTRGRRGLALFGSLLLLGAVRENYVALWKLLYGFSPSDLMLGEAPLIASIIWGYSIYLAVVWAEEVTGEPLRDERPPGRFLAAAALFMIALACFYEPFLALIRMARWQEGHPNDPGRPLDRLDRLPHSHRPLPAPVGIEIEDKPLLHPALVLLGAAHAEGLQALKDFLGW